MSVPEAWPFVLLALAVFRTWKLVGDDAILDRPRDQAIEWLEQRGHGTKFEYFITCPWCAGAWISLTWWAAWQAWPHATLVVAALAALSAAAGYLGVIIDRLEG